MGRAYTVEIHNFSVSAAQDLIALFAGAMPFRFRGLVIGQIDKTTVENLALSIKVLRSTVTAGTGGAAATPKKVNEGDSAPTVTARRGDTGQATTNSSSDQKHSDTFNLVNGYSFFPPEEFEWNCPVNGALVVSLDTAPASAYHFSATLFFEELV